MTSLRFLVELPHHDSDREGTLLDVRDAIARLKHVSSEVFSRVEARIEEETVKLEAMERRIEAVRQRIAAIAAQPSKATVIQTPSRVSRVPHCIKSAFAELPVQSLGSIEADEHRFRGRRTADQDEDPAVPVEALLEMDRRIVASVALRVREASEQTREIALDLASAISSSAWWSQLVAGRSAEDRDEEEMGPAPHSLKFLKHTTEEDEDSAANSRLVTGNLTGTVDGNRPVDVAYRPRAREAHQLGLPSNLTALLPDIAEPATFLPISALRPAPIGKTSVQASAPLAADEVKRASPKDVKLEIANTSVTQDASSNPTSTSAQESQAAAQNVGPPAVPTDPTRMTLLAAIREARPLHTKSGGAHRQTSEGASPAKTVKRPVTLADEMREKLARRQKALSGERDEEEQHAERQKRRMAKQQFAAEAGDDRSSDSGGSSLPSHSPALATAPPKLRGAGGTKRARDPVTDQPSTLNGNAAGTAFAGLDALLNRELSAKSAAVFKPPPKPASSVGDWEDD